MTPLVVLGVVVAGGAGAVARFVLDAVLTARTAATYPVGTLVVNVTGSLVLGVVTGLVLASAAPDTVRLVMGTGFLGGYTTFSTASVQTLELLQRGRIGVAAGYAGGTLVLTTTAAALGLWLASLT